MEEHRTAQDMVDVTDCLEARDAFRGMKNFCFWLMLLSLLILQGVFWLDRGGWIDHGNRSSAGWTGTAPEKVMETDENNGGAPLPAAADSQEAAAEETPARQEPPAASAEEIAQQAREVTEEVGAGTDAKSEEKPAESEEPKTGIDWAGLKLPMKNADLLIRIFNFLLLFTAVLYCLTLLITLKISLVSRLGGISHISRAFFISLFLLMFLFPWQCVAPGVLLGAMYLPRELFCFYPAKAAGSTLWLVVLFLRFVGLWLLILWLLLWSWMRSGKWYRATQRRLGIVS